MKVMYFIEKLSHLRKNDNILAVGKLREKEPSPLYHSHPKILNFNLDCKKYVLKFFLLDSNPSIFVGPTFNVLSTVDEED